MKKILIFLIVGFSLFGVVFSAAAELYTNPQKYEFYENHTSAIDSITGSNWIGQTFTPSLNHRITSIKLWLKRTSQAATGTSIFSIRNTLNGLPTGEDLCSTEINTITIPTITGGALFEIPFNNCELLANTQYAVIVRYPTGDTLKRFVIYGSLFSGYAKGTYIGSNNSGSSFFKAVEWDNYFIDWGISKVTIFSVSSSFVTSSLAYIRQLFTDLAPVIIMVLGLILAFWLIPKVIELFKLKK